MNKVIVQQPKDGRLYIDFAACLENVEHLCAHVQQFLQKQDIPGSGFDIFLILRELVNNAVIHGSKCDTQKRVKVILTLEETTLTIEVEDQGQGFDWQRNMTGDGPDLDSCCGRGLHIAKMYADSWAYAGRGNRVIVTKSLHT